MALWQGGRRPPSVEDGVGKESPQPPLERGANPPFPRGGRGGFYGLPLSDNAMPFSDVGGAIDGWARQKESS